MIKNVQAGFAVNNPSVKVSFQTGDSKQDKSARITAASITIQNLNGPGKGCPVASTKLGALQKAINNGTDVTTPADPPANNTSANDTPSNGTPANNTAHLNPPANGTTPADSPVNSTTPANPPANSTTPADPPANGTTLADPPVNSTTPVHLPVNNTQVNDTPPNGTPANNTTPASPPVNSTTPADPPVNSTTPAHLPVNNTQANDTPPNDTPANNTTPADPPANNTATGNTPANDTTPATDIPAGGTPDAATITRLAPELGFKSGINPTGTGDCDGAIDGADGKPIKIPCACPPAQDVYISVRSGDMFQIRCSETDWRPFSN